MCSFLSSFESENNPNMDSNSITIKSEDEDDNTVLDRSIFSEMEPISNVIKSEIKEETNLDISLCGSGEKSFDLKTEDEETTKNKYLFVDAISTFNNSETDLDSICAAENSHTINSINQAPYELVKESTIHPAEDRLSNVLGEEDIQIQDEKVDVQVGSNQCFDRHEKPMTSIHMPLHSMLLYAPISQNVQVQVYKSQTLPGDDYRNPRNQNQDVTRDISGDNDGTFIDQNPSITIEMAEDGNEKVRTRNHSVAVESPEDNDRKIGNQNEDCSTEVAKHAKHKQKTLRKAGGKTMTKSNPDNEYGSTKKVGSKKAIKDSKLKKSKKSARIPQKFTCDTCNKKFAGHAKIRDHVLIHIHNRKMYPCNYCHKEFVSNQWRRKHQVLHTSEAPFECGQCEMCFRTSRRLREHEFKVHEKHAPYLCEKCGKSFYHNLNYKRHLTVHSGEKNLECKFCQKRFRLHRDLSRHLEIHQKLVCDVCSETFEGRLELRRHMMTHNKKAYQCDQCEASFDQNCNLTKHKVIHLGLKPYKCHMCDYSVAHRSNLNKHLKISHNLTPKSAGWLGLRRDKSKS